MQRIVRDDEGETISISIGAAQGNRFGIILIRCYRLRIGNGWAVRLYASFDRDNDLPAIACIEAIIDPEKKVSSTGWNLNCELARREETKILRNIGRFVSVERWACDEVRACVDSVGNSRQGARGKKRTGAAKNADHLGVLSPHERAATAVTAKPWRGYEVTQFEHIARGKSGSC